MFSNKKIRYARVRIDLFEPYYVAVPEVLLLQAR